MSGINLGRVILGGLVAGLIINVVEAVLNQFLMVDAIQQAMAARNLAMPDDPMSLGIFIAYGFVFGIALIFVYAAIRPRFGAGAKTAVYAGVIVWFIGGFLVSVLMATMGIFPAGLMTIGAAVGLVETCVAAVAGAALYQEGEAVATE